MRSRYTAYTLANIDYIFDTMRGEALKAADRKASLQWARAAQWLGLKILNVSVVSADSQTGFVEFVARYVQDQQPCNLQENSEFRKYGGRWYYVGKR